MIEKTRVLEVPELRDRIGIFRNRREAGEVLGRLVGQIKAVDPLVLAVPAGGVPVAVAVAAVVEGELDVAVVSKITPPGNTEVGYGAVAFDGSVRLNRDIIPRLGLKDVDVLKGIEMTRGKVARRMAVFRGERPMPEMTGRTVILVDDGLASGYTMLTAIEAVRHAGAGETVVAVPTGHEEAVEKMVRAGTGVCCANIRGGWRFAVADAYRDWYDVTEEEARMLLEGFAADHPEKPG